MFPTTYRGSVTISDPHVTPAALRSATARKLASRRDVAELRVDAEEVGFRGVVSPLQRPAEWLSVVSWAELRIEAGAPIVVHVELRLGGYVALVSAMVFLLGCMIFAIGKARPLALAVPVLVFWLYLTGMPFTSAARTVRSLVREAARDAARIDPIRGAR